MGQIILTEESGTPTSPATNKVTIYPKADGHLYKEDSLGNEVQFAEGGSVGINELTGDVTAGPGNGSQVSTVAFVGGSSAANVHSAELLANAATASNIASTIVKRDSSGNFSAGTVTANLVGNASGSAATFTGSLGGDITGNQGTTLVSKIQGTVVSGTTGSGNVVFSLSPTFTGTVIATNATLSGMISAFNLVGTNTGDQTIVLTGDVSGSGTGTFGTTLANTPVVVGSYGSATQVGTFTVDSKGRLTASSDVSIQLSESQVTGLVSDLAGKQPIGNYMLNPAFTVGQTVYVAVGGNDSTGDGSIGNPWKTVHYALSQITTASSNNRFIIKLMGGKIVDTIAPLLKPWIYIVGDEADGTYWRVTAPGASIGIDPSFVTGRAGIANVYIGAGTNLNLDFYAIGPNSGTPSAVIDLEHLYVTGYFIFNGRSPDIDFLQMSNVFVFGTTNIEAAQCTAISCTFEGSADLTSTNAGANSQFQGCLFQTNVAISGTSANLELFAASPIQGSLSVVGSSTVLTADAISLPPVSAQTVSGGASIVLLGDALNHRYYVTTPGNWSTLPLTVGAALDELAATVSGLSNNSITSIGTIDSQIASANGAVIEVNQLILQSASPTVPGLVNTLNQAFSGVKTFNSGIISSVTGSASLNVLKAGDSMSGSLNLTGHSVTNLAAPVNGGDATNKTYVDTLAGGIIPQDPVQGVQLVDDSLSSPPVSPQLYSSYIIAGTPSGAWSSFVAGDKVSWTGTAWEDSLGRQIQIGDRFGVNFNNSLAPLGGNMVGHQDYIITITNATPGSFAYTYTPPLYRWTTLNNSSFSATSNETFYYNAVKWVVIASGFSPTSGTGIKIVGNTINALYDTTSISINGSNQLEVVGVGGSTAAQIHGATEIVEFAGPYTVLGNNTAVTGPVTDNQFTILGTPGYSDSGILGQWTSNVAGYNQMILQNISPDSAASTNFIVSNNIGGATSYFGEFGMNSSNYTGLGSFNLPNAVFLDVSNGDLVLGTTTNNSIHFVTNNSNTDVMTITGSAKIGINNPSPVATLDVIGYGIFTGSLTASNLSGNNTGDQTITLTGEITGSGTGSFAATISAGVITTAKLSTITDGITLDQLGSGNTLEVKALGVNTAQLAANSVTNAKLAQAPSNTIKGNNTGVTANELDLTGTQVTAMLSPFTGDTGSGGLQGLVPAPAAGTRAAGDFLSANGSWTPVDQSKPIYQPFSLVGMTPNPYALAKVNNVISWTGLSGKTYAATVGTSSSTIAIYDVTNQAAPVLLSNMATLQGAYNAIHVVISSHDYIIVSSSGGFNLYIIDVTNPYSPTVTTTFGVGAPAGSLYNLAYQAGYVYLATQNQGLIVIDIGGGLVGGTLLAPVKSFTQGSAKSLGVAVAGNTIYTTQYSVSPFATRLINSWTLTGLGTAAVPSLLQSLVLPGLGETLGVTLNSNTAFISDTTGVEQIDVVDITTPSAMTNLSQITVPNILSAAMVAVPFGNYILVPTGSNVTYGGWVGVYDLTVRTAPVLVATVTAGTPASPFGGIALDPRGGYFYVGDYGIAPGSAGSLDVLTMPVLNQVVLSAIIDNLTTTNPINGSVVYAPSIPANWSPVPAIVQTALDTLAARPLGITALTSDVSASGSGSVVATVNSVGGSSAANVHSAELAANAATPTNTPSTIVKRDISGNFTAGTITANLTGTASGNDLAGAASTVQTNLNNYIDPASMQLSWDYNNPHYYTEILYTGSQVSTINYWDSPSKITKIFRKDISYTGSLVSQIVITRITDSKTLTKTIAYTGTLVSGITRT